jgi:hypothetical protein
MAYETLKNERFKSIKIDDDLYKKLRKHCDKIGIRFKDFVEDSLENAIHIDRSTELLRSEIVELKKKTTSYDYAFKRGFEKGLFFLFLSVQGRLDYTLKKDEIDIVKDKLYRTSKGTQLAIFDEDK